MKRSSMLGMGDEGAAPQPQLSEGRGMAASPTSTTFSTVRDFLQDRVVTVVRWGSGDREQMKISVADEDALIEQGDAAARSEGHEDIRPDLGGWTGGLCGRPAGAGAAADRAGAIWRQHSAW